jgi:hypothetical protein
MSTSSGGGQNRESVAVLTEVDKSVAGAQRSGMGACLKGSKVAVGHRSESQWLVML